MAEEYKTSTHTWMEPLHAAAAVANDTECCLLYSAASNHASSRYSYLAYDSADIISDNGFDALEQKLSHDTDCFANAWFGWLGYELKNILEELPATNLSHIALPALHMVRYHTILVFDHAQHTLTAHSTADEPLARIAAQPLTSSPANQQLRSPATPNLPRERYIAAINDTIEQIRAGAFYQANITVKHYSEQAGHTDPFALYLQQCAQNPAPYSAFINHENTAIISASPECFLHIDAHGAIFTKPIKGTIARDKDETEDSKHRNQLLSSAKDKAENLMIVDLMRNDLARVCEAGSVEVSELYALESFAHLHHLVSHIRGTRAANICTLDVIKACFPPGSMTGAPKIAAMKWISAIEQMDRGVYSGAIGFLGGDGSAHLNVVIRTLLAQHSSNAQGKPITRIEAQAGGGIVADSVAEDEWAEMQVKLGG